MDSLVFDTVVGIVFVFAVFAFAVAGIVEGITRLVGLRAEFLLRGVSSMLDGNAKFGKGWLPELVRASEKGELESGVKALAADTTKLDAAADDTVVDKSLLSDVLAKVTALLALPAMADARADATKALPTFAELGDAATAAQSALDKAREEVEKEQARLDALPPTSTDRDALRQRIELSRTLLAPAESLLAGLHANAWGVNVATVLGSPIVDLTAAVAIPADLRMRTPTRKQKRNLPSYVSASTFSQALMHTLVPDPATGTTTVDELKTAVDRISDPKLRAVLKSHVDAAGGEVAAFRTALEQWYDDHMERVSGWYKRHTKTYTLAVATLLAVFFNVNAAAMTQALYSDQALRDSVVTAAFQSSHCGTTDSSTTPAECLADVRNQIDQLRSTGLPIGWSRDKSCLVVDTHNKPVVDRKCDFWEQIGVTSNVHEAGLHQAERQLGHVVLLLLGWAIIALSSLVGARFWFDALSRLGSLRSSGPKPKTAT